jgi:hypothetical protein
MSNTALNTEKAAESVIEFVTQMNDWETRRHFLGRLDRDMDVPADVAAQLDGATIDGLDAEYHTIFEARCTTRSRTYGGFPSVWCEGGQYKNVSAESVETAQEVRDGVAEVIAAGGEFEGQRFKFIVFASDGKWLIDSAYSASDSHDWGRHPL